MLKSIPPQSQKHGPKKKKNQNQIVKVVLFHIKKFLLSLKLKARGRARKLLSKFGDVKVTGIDCELCRRQGFANSGHTYQHFLLLSKQLKILYLVLPLEPQVREHVDTCYIVARLMGYRLSSFKGRQHLVEWKVGRNSVMNLANKQKF